jgi:hypothetical protein
VRNYRWRVERTAELEEQERQRKLEAERVERERREKLEQARVDRLYICGGSLQEIRE